MERNEFWEFSLKVNISKTECLMYLKSKVEGMVKRAKGVITTIYSPTDVTLLIGVNLEQKMVLKPIVYSIITDIIVEEYKKDYITSKFDFGVKNDLMFQSFVRALVSFDSDIDKQIIYQKLTCYDNIVLQSFVDFRLKILKSKWNDLISLANDNYLYLLSGGNFLELMKFLLSNLECKVKNVKVVYSQGIFKLYSGEKELKPLLFDSGSSQDMVMGLIGLCPEKISLCDSPVLDKNIVSFLYELFGTKLEIIK